MSEGAMGAGVLTFARAGFQMFFTSKEAAAFLGVHADTLEKWRKAGEISRRKGIMGDTQAMYYTLPDLLEFVATRPKG